MGSGAQLVRGSLNTLRAGTSGQPCRQSWTPNPWLSPTRRSFERSSTRSGAGIGADRPLGYWAQRQMRAWARRKRALLSPGTTSAASASTRS